MSDGPRGEEGGSGGTEEAGTFQTRSDSAQDANRLCRWTDFIINLSPQSLCLVKHAPLDLNIRQKLSEYYPDGLLEVNCYSFQGRIR